MGRKDRLAAQEGPNPPGHKGLLDRPELRANKAPLGPLGLRDQRGRKGRREFRVPLERPDPKVLRVLREERRWFPSPQASPLR